MRGVSIGSACSVYGPLSAKVGVVVSAYQVHLIYQVKSVLSSSRILLNLQWFSVPSAFSIKVGVVFECARGGVSVRSACSG